MGGKLDPEERKYLHSQDEIDLDRVGMLINVIIFYK